jgi:hypothetical protein
MRLDPDSNLFFYGHEVVAPVIRDANPAAGIDAGNARVIVLLENAQGFPGRTLLTGN